MSSSPELPPALRPQSNKRKRLASVSDRTSIRSTSVASDTINPRSHSPSSIRQLSVAGVPIEEDDPTKHVPDFPHRRLPLEALGDDEEESDRTDAGDGDGADRRSKTKRQPRDALTGHNAVLLRLIYENLDRGDIQAASRFYGHLLQRRDRGRPITVRLHNLWAIGAEILMREGERPADTHGAEFEQSKESKLARQRWGRAANMPKVRAYYDTLIRDFPFDYRRPDRTDAVDFWLALLNCEFYNTYTEQNLGLMRIDDPESSDREDESQNGSDAEPDGQKSFSSRERRTVRDKEALRKRTLASMEGLASKIDELTSEPPYSKHDEFKRLRAMISLYIADLLVPHAVEWEAETRVAEEKKRREQDFAREILQKIRRNGTVILDRGTLEWADPEGENEEERGMVYSSLPIRGV